MQIPAVLFNSKVKKSSLRSPHICKWHQIIAEFIVTPGVYSSREPGSALDFPLITGGNYSCV